MALAATTLGSSGAASSPISPTSARGKPAGPRRRLRTASLRALRVRKAMAEDVNRSCS